MTTSGPADWTQAAGGPSPLPVLGMCILAAVSTDVCSQFLSCVQLLATPWTVTHQALLSTAILRQEYWSGLPLPSPGNLPDPGIEPGPPVLQADSLPSESPGKPLLTCLTVLVQKENLHRRFEPLLHHKVNLISINRWLPWWLRG